MDDVRVHDELVRWTFDNSDFEKKAAQTLTTLQRLEKALHINTVVDIAKGIKLDHLAKDVDTVAQKFTAFGIMGKKVLENLADRAQKTGEEFVKSLTIKDAQEGFKKYEEQVGSVQTLMNTTGLTAKEIQKYVDKFAIYSDETSYSLDQMVRAFSQMTTVADLSGTAADKANELKKIQDMIIGIANASAFAGKTGQEFSRTIYNLTQSYQTGSLKLMDWRSLQMAGTASKQLMEEMIKAGEDLYKQSKGKNGFKEGTVTVQNFNDVLKKGVITTEVMENAFGKFGELAVAAAEGVQTGEYETFADAVDALGDSFSELSKKATESAWSAKTFKEAFFSIHDAVSTQWAKTYQIIIGDYEEAKALWSNVAEVLFDIFGQAGIQRNKMLKEWANENGRFFLVASLQNILNSILSFVNPIKQAWNSVFTPLSGHDLANLTRQLYRFTHGLILSFESQAKLKSITYDFARALKGLLDILKQVVAPIETIIGPLDEFGNKVLTVLKILSLLTNRLVEMASKSETTIKVLRVLLPLLIFRKKIAGSVKAIMTLTKVIVGLVGVIKLLGLGLAGIAAYSGVKWLINWFTNGKGAEGIAKVKSEFEKFQNTLNSLNSWKLEDYINALKNFGETIKSGVLKGLGDIGERIKQIDWRSMFSPKIVAGVDNFIDKIDKLKQLVSAFKDSISTGKINTSSLKTLADLGLDNFTTTFKNIVRAGIEIKNFGETVKNGLSTAKDAVKNFFAKDTLTGLSPFENTLTRIKDTFSSKEGFLRSLDSAKNSLKNVGAIAVAPWKLSTDNIKELKEQLQGIPKLILDGSLNFKGFLDNLKNPETIKSFGKTLGDAFSSLGSKAISGFNTLTNGRYSDAINKFTEAFGRIKSAVSGIPTKGIETFRSVLSRLYSLIGSSSYVISKGIERIKEVLGGLDEKLGEFGGRVVSIASNLRNKLPGFLSPLFNIIDTLKGGKYSKIFELVKSIFTDLQTAISRFGGDGIKDFTASVKNLFATFASGAPISRTLLALKDAISSFVGMFRNAGTNMSAPVRTMTEQTNVVTDTLSKFKDRITYILNGIKSVTHKINDIIPPELAGNIIKLVGVVAQLVIIKKVGKSLKDALVDIKTGVGNATQGLLSPFKALGDSIPKIFAPFQSLAEGITNLSVSIGTAISSLTDSLRGKWKAEAFQTRANGIFKLASSVAVLASAVWIVAQIPIDKGQLFYATGAILTLMVTLLTFASIFDKLGQSWLQEIPKLESVTTKLAGSIFYFGKSSMIASLAISLVAMAGAVTMLIGPIKELSKMSLTQFASGGLKVAAMMIVLGATVGIMGHAVKGAGPGILAATLLLWALNGILEKFLVTMGMFGILFKGDNAAKMRKGADVVAQTLLVLTVTVGGIALALSKFTSNAASLAPGVSPASKALLSVSVLLAGIIFFLNQTAKIITKFRDLKVKATDIGVFFVAVGGILASIAGYAAILKVAGLTKDIQMAGQLMLGFGSALAFVALALHLFSTLDMDKLGDALPAVIGSVMSLLAVITILGTVGKGMSFGSGLALVGFAAVIVSLSASLMLLTLVDYAKLENASTSLSKVLIALGVSLGLAGSFGAKATSMIGFTFVIKELTTSLLILSFIDFAKLDSAANNLSKVLLSLAVTMLFSGSMATAGIFQWIGIIGVIGALVASLLLLQDVDTVKLQRTATILGALEIVSGLMVGITSLLPPGGGARALASLAGASLVILALSGLLYVTGQIPDPEKAAELLNSTTIFISAIGVVIYGLGQLNPGAGVQAAIALLGFIGVLAIVLMAFGEFTRADVDVTNRMLEDLHLAFTELGKFIGDFAGGFIAGMTDKAGDSLEKVQTFLESIKTLKDAISPDEATGISNALGIAKDILSLQIPNDGGLAGLIFGDNNIGDFGVSISRFGFGLKSFAESISGLPANEQEIQNAITMANGLAQLAHAIPNSGDSIAAAMVGTKDLGEFAAQIAGDSFGRTTVNANGHSGASRSFAEGATQVAQSNRGLGAAMRMFVDSVKDIPEDAYKSANKAIKAAEAIADFAQHVPKSGGLLQDIIGVHNLAAFAESLVGNSSDGSPGFAESLSTFINEMDAVEDPKAAIKKLDSTQPLIDFFNRNTSIWDSFTTSVSQFLNQNTLAVAAHVMTGYAQELGELQKTTLDTEKLTSLTQAIMATEPLVEFLNGNTNIWSAIKSAYGYFVDDEGSQANMLSLTIKTLGTCADELEKLSTHTVNGDKLKALGDSFEASENLLTFFNDNTSWIDSLTGAVRRYFDAGTNPLADAIKALIPYADSLKDYSDKISKIPNMTQVVTSTYALGQFVEAVKTLFGVQNFNSVDTFSYIGNFTSYLTQLADGLVDFATKFGDVDVSAASDNTNLVIETLQNMTAITGETSDGFITAINKLGQVGLDEFYSKFENATDHLNSSISTFIGEAVSILSRKPNQDRMKTGAINLYNGFLEGQKQKLDEIKDNLEKFIGQLPSVLDTNDKAFYNLGMKIPNSIARGIEDGAHLVIDATRKVEHDSVMAAGDEIHDAGFDPWQTDIAGAFHNLGMKMPFSTAKGVEDGSNFVMDALTGLYNKASTTFTNLFSGDGSFLEKAKTSVGGMFADLKTMLTGQIGNFLGVDLTDIWENSFIAGGEEGTGFFANLLNDFFGLFEKKSEDTSNTVTENANAGANGVGKAVKSAGDKAVQEAKKAGKEILTEEDAFWVALLAKKRAGANAAEYEDMKVKDFEKKMLEEVNKLVDDYKEKLNSTTDDILGMIGLFDSVEEKVEETEETFGDLFKGISDNTSKLEGNINDLFKRVDAVTKSDEVPVSGDLLMANLQDQIDKYTEYYDIQDNLAKRINNNKLKKTLKDMTIDSIQELKALNEMSDDELNKYVDLFNKRVEVAARGKVKKEAEESPTAELLTKNLEDQVEKYKDYKEVITNLNARVTSSKLKETLNGMSIDNIEQLKVIESMTDEELSHYVALFEEKYSLSRTTAEVKLEETKKTTEDKLDELLETTGLKLDDFLEQFDGTLGSLTDLIEKHLTGGALPNAVGHMAQQLINVLLGVFNNAQMSTEEKIAEIQKQIENAAALGVDLTDQYSQGIVAILANTEMTADDKLQAILTLMTNSQVSLAQTSKNLAETTKSTIAKILSDAEAAKLVKSLISTLNDGVSSAQDKIDKFKAAIQQAGENNVQISEVFRARISEILSSTTLDADTQIQRLLEILNEATASYQNWAIQDIGLLSADLVNMSKLAQSNLNTAASGQHETIKQKLRETTDASEEEIETMAESIESSLDNMTSSAISSQESFSASVQDIVKSHCDATVQEAQAAADALEDVFAQMRKAKQMAARYEEDDDDDDDSDSRDPIGMWESATGKTLTDAQKEFARNGGAIVGGGGSQVIKDGRYWDSKSHMSYDIGSGAAHDALAGFRDTISDGLSSMHDSGESAAESFSDGFTGPGGLDEHSPSKKMMEFARFALLGWANGIDQYSHLVSESGQSSADSYVNVFNEAMRNIDMPEDISPVITPIIDISRAQASMDALDNFFTTEKSYSMASDIKRATDLAQKAKAIKEKPAPQPAPKPTTMNFTQNNYSPKALSKLDIYRQTKNQFAQMKGALA